MDRHPCQHGTEDANHHTNGVIRHQLGTRDAKADFLVDVHRAHPHSSSVGATMEFSRAIHKMPLRGCKSQGPEFVEETSHGP